MANSEEQVAGEESIPPAIRRLQVAVRASHERYKQKCDEVAFLTRQVSIMQREAEALRAALLAQSDLVSLAEQVLAERTKVIEERERGRSR